MPANITLLYAARSEAHNAAGSSSWPLAGGRFKTRPCILHLPLPWLAKTDTLAAKFIFLPVWFSPQTFSKRGWLGHKKPNLTSPIVPSCFACVPKRCQCLLPSCCRNCILEHLLGPSVTRASSRFRTTRLSNGKGMKVETHYFSEYPRISPSGFSAMWWSSCSWRFNKMTLSF